MNIESHLVKLNEIKFFELLLAQSGGIFEATAFAGPCEVSRPTINNYLKAMEATGVCHVIKPFSTHRPTEITSAPKVYGFDTGFICYYRGWTELRTEDKGDLWEHNVLNEIHSRTQGALGIRYWRDKQRHEGDLVLKRRGGHPITVECKWSSKKFNGRNLQVFLKYYPSGDNWVVAPDVDRSFKSSVSGFPVQFMGINEMSEQIDKLLI